MTSLANHLLPLNGNSVRMSIEDDIRWMRRALDLAGEAERAGEVPVGAVLVLDHQVIADSHNSPIQLNDPTAHAEILALRRGASRLNNYRLLNTTLYVTLEPCLMCAGAMVHARVKRLVYGAADPRTGVAKSVERVFEKPYLNHRVEVTSGILHEDCGLILSQFFQAKR